MRHAHRQSGLTVLEVILASSLLVLFLGALFFQVWIAIGFRDVLDKEVAPYTTGPPVMDLIETDLRHALVEPYRDSVGLKAESESMGGADSTLLDLVTVVTSRSSVDIDGEYVRSAICEVGYRLRRSELYDELFAIYRREDFAVDDEPFEGGKFYKLADRVLEFRVEFFAEDPGDPEGDEAEGLEEWDSEKEKGLPWGCRITLVIVPPVETDDQGNIVEDVEPIEFVRYVAFPGRHDADTSGDSPGNNDNPGNGN